MNLHQRVAYLCEVTYSATLHSELLRSLAKRETHWSAIKAALSRDCGIAADWSVQPWVFMPSDRVPLFKKKLSLLNPGATDSINAKPKTYSS